MVVQNHKAGVATWKHGVRLTPSWQPLEGLSSVSRKHTSLHAVSPHLAGTMVSSLLDGAQEPQGRHGCVHGNDE